MQHKNSEIFLLIEKYINDFYEDNGSVPQSCRIADDLLLSTATISRYISQMKKDGRIIVDKNGKNTTVKIQKIHKTNIEVPVVGSIACETPVWAEENIETYFIMSKEIIGDIDCFFLKAKGESMINAGIDDGDLVLIRKQEYARSGDIAAMLLDNDATLKRVFFENNGKIRLHPENDDMEDFYVDECKIQGIVTKVIKDVD